jgi:SAM-dependent methyltransferase
MPACNLLASSLLKLAGELLEEGGDDIGAQDVPALTTPFSNTTQSDWAEAVQLWNTHGRRLLSQIAPRNCPACTHGSSRRLFDSYDGYTYVECDACGCWYVPLHIDAAIFDRFFELCPEAERVAMQSFVTRQAPENVTANINRIGGYLDVLLPLLPDRSGKRYLDIGCGLGHSLMAAQDRGLEATGVESSRACISIGRANGLDIRDVSSGLPPGPFHLVTFWESLEHIADPSSALSACECVLDEHGILAFTVPNQNSPLIRAQRGDCSIINGGCDTPGHINLFNPSNIRRLLDRSGFALLGLDGQYGLSLPELLSYMVGNTRGAQDMLSGKPVDSRISELATSVTKWIGPAVTLLERITLTTPILFGFACRTPAVADFTRIARLFASRRKAALQDEIATCLSRVT